MFIIDSAWISNIIYTQTSWATQTTFDLFYRKIKTNYFIVSLAFADLLVSVLVMPFGAIELVHQHWIYGETFCLVRTSLDVLLTTASILHLCCIALDRWDGALVFDIDILYILVDTNNRFILNFYYFNWLLIHQLPWSGLCVWMCLCYICKMTNVVWLNPFGVN